MDSSAHSASSTSDELGASLLTQDEGGTEGEEAHIHLPNPSYWPILVGLGIAITIFGLLFISSGPWITIIGVIFVFITIIGWGLEDPMAPLKEKFVHIYQPADRWKFKIGQNVIDSQGHWLGKVQARFKRYILVERGALIPKVYYVPQSSIKDQIKSNTIFLAMSEDELVRGGFNSPPPDLYDEAPEPGIPIVRGAAQFAKRPLSPAETGHYVYGKHWPGINTDASGSYHRDEVRPTPQTYVTEGTLYTTDKPIPPREISPD